ncbi:MAG: TIGR04255 family protein [Dongiaceae bacterium]
MAAHPSYSNPQLVEAICDIHFKLSATDPWKPSKPGALFKAVQETYPEIEPITEQGVQLVFGPDSMPTQQLLPPRIRFKLRHRERPILLQISEQTFTINALKPYPGWEQVKGELAAVWPRILEIVKPEALTRIGMRYINRVLRRTADEPPSFWLQACDFIPTAVLRSGPGFLLRLESGSDTANRAMITLAHDRSDQKELHGALILDIDRITERQINPGWNDLDAAIETLHNEIWEIFRSARGPNLDALLAGKL